MNEKMKIVVIGGSGLIGTKVVNNLRQRGYEVVAASPSTGINTITGEGLADALAGARVVVDVANAHAITSADSTTPMVRMRPGVVHRNHQRGCTGLVGEREASGSVDGCANSTVTCWPTSSRF